MKSFAVTIGVLLGFLRRKRIAPTLVPGFIKKKLASYNDSEMQWNLGRWSYQAVIRQGSKIVSFNLLGTLKKVATEIDFKDAPVKVKTNLTKKYAGYFLKKAFEVNAKDRYTYQFEMSKGLDLIQLVFTPDGTLIRARNYALVN